MNLYFKDKEITGMLVIMPSNEIKFEDEMENYNFSTAKSLKLKAALGLNKRRVASEGICASDLAIKGLDFLFSTNKLQKEDIDALIFVTQSPDYIMPPTSNVIQGHFSLKQDMICLDINQGCAGFIIGLNQAFMLLEQPSVSKVVMINADVLSTKVSKRDRNSNPLIGDAASITIIEKSSDKTEIFGTIKMDGSGAFSLQIPAGGARLPISNQTAIMHEDVSGNFRSKENLVMKGDDVFNFVQAEVPPMIESLLQNAKVDKNIVDYYMFHQPNKFMLNKVADKIGISREKMPANVVENFGNSSGVTIPVVTCFNIAEQLKQKRLKICFAGFGVGLTWASLLMDVGPLTFCEIIEY
ncbi:3-oxoacyl-ACP synthase [Flavobacterium sp. Leaf82]|jgi:3-oxoacyl-[acyl-carrier-protein] synthase-3|uniref:3-oxoacyl-ACP synthase III family protein n=1 Tax=unclassified Flavobacterium TaxID=196869 RepID=UPI0006F7FA2A|nr:3-oxoacyl-[acyl-carrier-protein] synthase III C-terminal domain-containing protein [Flavobacterium sp. Leaf82]KQO33261.1 3-oxoacyl-ACP synthase [Flavobacterium sp. Leaf82]